MEDWKLLITDLYPTLCEYPYLMLCTLFYYYYSLVSFDDPLQAMDFAQAKIESLVAYVAESDEEGKIGINSHYSATAMHMIINLTCTMEPLYNRHLWDQQTCPFNRGVLC